MRARSTDGLSPPSRSTTVRFRGGHYDRDPLLRRLELPDFELFGSPPLEPLDELLEAVRRLPLDELAAFERLPLLLRLPLLSLSLSLLLRRLPLRLLCDSRCCLTSPSSMVPRQSPSGSSFMMA